MERADRIAAMTQKRRALLARRLRGRPQGDAAPGGTIPRRAGQAATRLSFAQERLWFMERWHPGSTVYNLLDAVRLTGRLDVANLADAFAAVVRRHESLRSVVVEIDGVPFQEVRRPSFECFPVVDLTTLPPSLRSTTARTLAAAEGRHGFDLASEPLFRTLLLRLGPREHLLVLVTHHIMTDLWSFGVLIRELGEFYKTRRDARDAGVSALPEPEIQYADFAAWQREWLSGEVLRRELDYWKQQLAGAPSSLELPTDRPRPSAQGFRGASLSFSLPAPLSAGLRALAQSSGATLFMVFTAALSALLGRYTGQQDVLLGSPIAGRNRRELEPLIGFFVNTLVLRTDLSGNPTFQELLNRVRETTLEAFAHQDVPFDRLVEELQPVRDPSRPPLVQVVLAFQRSLVEDLELPGLSLSSLDMGTSTAKFDLTFFMTDDDCTLTGAIEYDTDLFTATRIGRLAGHFRKLLEEAVTKSLRPLQSLALLSPAEDQQLLEWNDTEAAYPRESTPARMLATQAAKRPDKVAVVEVGVAGTAVAISFRELLRRADRVARALRALGVGPEILVGLLAERSLSSLIATAGILRSGGAYLPLDPNLPRERLQFMIADGGVPVVLAESRLVALVRSGGVEVLTIESALAASESEEPVDDGFADPGQLAYVNYTSGSTGTPKGVGVTHRSIVRLLFGVAYARFGPRESFLHLAPASFDASTLEVWAPLLHGGRCVLFPPEIPTAAALERVIVDFRVTSLWLTSSLFNQVVDEKPTALAGLEQLLVGGEELSVPHVRRAARSLPAIRLINGYGPTEGTTFTCCYPLPGVPEPEAAISIGRPIGNTRVYLVDPLGRRVPAAHPGELLIGGDGLARGYLNRPRWTGERFVPDPFGGVPGGRLYRSGDRARWLRDGRLDFQGRFDHQVKIRGFRIELGEIEARLAAHPGTKAVAVLAREDQPGDRRLVAYLVPAGAPPALERVRADLRRRLPDYMIPAAWVILDRLPLTPSGKVDRSALPAPDAAPAAEDDQAPRNWAEELLAEIWADVLGLERVGTDSSFFELGGHSLLAVQVASRVGQAFGVELPIRSFFEAPTLRDLAERIRAAGAGSAPRPGPVPVSRDRALPLSFAQERLWILDKLDLASTAYNISLALRAQGSLDHELLARSLSEIVRRHEILRTGFRTENDVPVQVIPLPVPLVLPVVDLRALPELRRRRQARRLAAEEASRPFDLAVGPKLRATLMWLSRDDRVVVVTMHHIASDGWSIGVLVRELGALYRAFAAGEPSPLPELGVQYADFAVWQRQWLAGEFLEAQSKYWKKRLGGARHVLDLPTDRPRPPMETFHGAVLRFSVPRRLLNALRALGRARGGTPFMVCLAAWQILLHRYTGQGQILVGSPVAGRIHREIEDLIGFFVNTLVLRSDLSREDSFVDLLARVRETTLDAFAHQDLPFERLVEDLQPERDLSRPPLVQVLFAFLNTPLRPLELPDLNLTPFDFDPGTAKFDLSLSVMETDDAAVGTFEYNTDLFDPTRIARAAGHFLRLLEGVCVEPERRLRDFCLLSPAERQQVLAEWNATRTTYPRGSCLHQLFELQAERSPGAVAVRFERESLTYRELDRRANRLASCLRSRGVGPEVVVGALLERSLEMVVALLGVLKSGGAYLPLDPSYPRERLDLFVADAAPPLVLSVKALADLVPLGQRALFLDEEQETPASSDSARPAVGTGEDRLAYVIYTSGSTGRPKGAMNAHRGIVNRIRWMQEAYGLGADDRVLQKTPFSFDVSVWEFFWPLAAGALLVMARPEGHRDPEYLNDVIAAEKVTTLHFVPSMLRAFLAAEARGRCRCLRRVIASGEELTTELGGRFHDRLPGVELHNLYGPTEAAVDVTAAPCRPAEVRRETSPGLSIGRPIANSRIHLLERDGHPVPTGVAGELHIGGVGVGRGYLARPGLSAECFVPDPFAASAGNRLYRTGDLARHRADGAIEFLGRADHQVKLRGFRIELGEIEATLRRLPMVREAVVVVRDQGLDRSLVAYVVTHDEGEPRSALLREPLRERLPDYMVPAVFVNLEELPLTPSGKIDRRRLPDPGQSASEATGTAPRTPSEDLLAGIWAEVLGRNDLGVEDDFFALGGHSLLAVQVVSRVRRVFGVEIPLRTVFEAPTIARLAQRLSAARSATASLPLVREPRDRPLPLSFAQERLWFLDQLDPGSAAYNVPVALRLMGELRPAALRASLESFVRRHEALRTTFAAEGEGPVQVVHPPAGFPLPAVDLRGLAAERREAEAELLLRAWALRPFDLERGPLARALLLRLGGREHRALFVLHHAVSDGWSMGILVREVSELYRAALAGVPPALAELPVQYADFAHWQRRWLRGEVLEHQIDYWRAQLAGLPILELPTDRPRPAEPGRRGAQLPADLDGSLVDRLRAFARGEGATLFMVLAAGFIALLGRLSGQKDVAIGSPVAGRGLLEIENLVGFFVNTLVLRADLGGGPGFGELLRRLRRVTLDAYAHPDVPFEKLVAELRPDRHVGTTPFFRVMLALQNTPFQDFELPGLVVEELALAGGPVKFDLTLALTEVPGGTLVASLSYSPELFDTTTLRRWHGHLTTFLSAAVTDPDTRIEDLAWLKAAERHQLVTAWAQTAAPEPPARSIPELFAERAAAGPDAVALVDAASGERLSYLGLARRARRLARRLDALGVGPEVPVGLCLERCLDMVVATLGILEAGGAYVPLDPSYPEERLRLMIDDVRAPVVVTFERFRHLFRGLDGVHIFVLDRESEAGAGGSPPAHGRGRAGPAHLAYVMYTSGSTGRPKGVAVRHGGVVRLVREADYLEFGTGQVFLQSSTISFDVATLEIWGPLLNGGRLVVAPAERSSSETLGRLVADHCVNTLWLTAGLFHQMVAHHLEALRPIRWLLAGGDVLSPTHVRTALEGLPETTLINGYGPTENTTFTSCHVLKLADTRGAVPIGRPIANTRLLILDRRLRPVPAGVKGIAAAAGPGLARCYFQRPALTAESFVPDPVSVGERLYLTGDLARHRADGTIEFLGRIDHQVKIRGFRIEPGEVEAALATLETVRTAAVMVRDDAPDGGKRLVAYVVPAGEGLDHRDLRRKLLARLPDYLVPSHFVTLDALPLNPSGKVNRQALPAPEARAGQVSRPPETPVEQLMAGIWAQILGVERIGVEDDFFEIGGHSLLATRVVSRVRESFGVELALQAIFETPTVSALAARIEGDGHEKSGPPILPVPRGRPLPLSFAQERFWFLDRLEPDNPAYNVSFALRLYGDLRPAALSAALDAVARRHETLRTTFLATAGGPRQVIADAVAADLPLVDLTLLAAADPERALRRRLAELSRIGFDLGAGPLVRAELLRLGTVEHVLAVVMHHIVTDGWSMGVWARDLGALYHTAVTGDVVSLPRLPLQYADFASWQRAWLEGGEMERQLAYWREQLAGAPEVLDLPLDRPRPARPSFRGSRLPVALPGPVRDRLHGLARRVGSTLFMVLLGGLATLLARLTGSRDVVVGTPVANRRHREIENLIGLFINTLVLRLDLRRASTGLDLLARARRVALEAYAHQDLPFERLVDALKVPRHLEHSALYQVALALQNVDLETPALPDLAIVPLDASPGPTIATKHDLTLRLAENESGLGGVLEYRADLFDRGTMARVVRQLERVLVALAASPERRLEELALLGPAERHQLVVEWNPAASVREARLIHHLFADQAATRPDAVAAFFQGAHGESFLSFSELDRRANRLARHLCSAGVGPEVLVAFFLEDAFDTLLALLAVFKAGGAYMALDPSLPESRLAFQVEDSRAAVLLTRRGLARHLPEHEARVVDLDASSWARLPPVDPNVRVDPRTFAYLIYTSGSTGRPKGVVGEHRQLLAYLGGILPELGDPTDASFGVHQSLAVDAPITYLLAALCGGGRLELMSPRLVADPRAMGERMARRPLDFLKTAPSHLEVLLDDARPRRLLPRRLAMLGGETLPRRLADAVLRHAPEVVVLNHYGPTETTVGVLTHRVVGLGDGRQASAPSPGRTSGVPLGRALSQARLHLVDRFQRLLPVGVAGELLIGGGSLARGYLRRASLTATRFVPDSFGESPGARLYRSGDLVRRLGDGTFEFLERIDHQVKVRGFRIELGEIEAVLEEHPSVRAAAVVARREQGEIRLAAYVVGGLGAEARRPADLGEHLRARLPEHMVPRTFTWLEHFPRTPQGKIDRHALPEPDAANETAEAAVPRDDVELRLARIWSETLGVDTVSIRQDFFDLGGHSLLAVRLLARIEKEFGRNLPLTTLFEKPTVEHLAEELRSAPGAAHRPVLVDIGTGVFRDRAAAVDPAALRPPFFCVHPVGGNVFCYVELARRLGRDQPFYGLQSPAPTGDSPSLEEVAARYVAEVRKVRPEGAYLLGGWSMGAVVAYEMARRLRDEGGEVALVAMIDAPPPRASAVEDLDAAELVALFVRDLSAGRAVLDPRSLRDLDRGAQLDRVLEICHTTGALPPATGGERLGELLEIFHRNFRALRAYVPRPYDGRIAWLRAVDTAAAVPDEGWTRLADVTLRHLPGNHYTLLTSPYVEALAHELNGLFEQSRRGGPGIAARPEGPREILAGEAV